MTASTDPTYPLYPIFAFLGFILSIIPLPWHIQAWNSGTCAFMIWTAVSCLNNFVNSIVWAGNLRNPAPVWCDISSKLIIGASVGIPAAVLCISRRLYYLTSGNVVSITREDKRRMVFVDLAIAVGMPVLIMTLHYVVQGHRFDILEDVGCYPVIYNTLPAYFLYFMWNPIFGCISFTFSAMTLRSFWKRRLQFNQLVTSNSSMSVSRYMRLVLLALIDIMCTVPLGIFSIYIGNKGVTLAPWISWEDTHYDFSRVGLVPSIVWRSNPAYRVSQELSRWLPVVCALLFFALFGFAAEAQKHYRLVFWYVMKAFGLKPTLGKQPSPPSGFSWNKPKGNNSTSTSLAVSLPPYALKSAQSPTSFQSASKALERISSFSASTHTAGDYELKAHIHSPNTDVEKSAGASSLFSDCDAATLYNHPPMYHIRLQTECMLQDANLSDDEIMFVPTPSSLNSTHFAAQQDLHSLSSTCVIHQPKSQTSGSSIRTIISPDRDRCSISRKDSSQDLSEERIPSATSIPPFVDTAAVSQPDTGEGHAIQVMVCKTETVTSGSL